MLFLEMGIDAEKAKAAMSIGANAQRRSGTQRKQRQASNIAQRRRQALANRNRKAASNQRQQKRTRAQNQVSYYSLIIKSRKHFLTNKKITPVLKV